MGIQAHIDVAATFNRAIDTVCKRRVLEERAARAKEVTMGTADAADIVIDVKCA